MASSSEEQVSIDRGWKSGPTGIAQHVLEKHQTVLKDREGRQAD